MQTETVEELLHNCVACFTDGNAPRKNSKEGAMVGTVGWGFVKLLIQNGVIVKEKEYYGKLEKGTVDIAEMTAIIEAMKSYLPAAKKGAKLPLCIVCDRQNLVKGFNEWIEGWKNKGWRNSTGKPVANLSYWKHADMLYHVLVDYHIKTIFIHMRGHRKGNEPEWMKDQNERADKLAERGRECPQTLEKDMHSKTT